MKMKKKSAWLAILLIIGGAAGLYFGSELFVVNGTIIAQTLGVSERVIGITVIAIGTSLPELATSVLAAIKKETEMALGNILGSNIMNVLSIIGFTAVIKPIRVAEIFIYSDFLWMLGFTIILLPIFRINYTVSRLNGVFLVLGYFIYVFFLLQ